MSKFDVEKPLFVGPVAARADTVFDALRQTVRDLQHDGNGASYGMVEANMLANFKPKNAKKYDGSYIKAYVRDAVSRFNYLSQEEASDYSVVEAKSKSEKPADPEVKTKIIPFIISAGEVTELEYIDSSKITIEDMASEFGRKTKTITKAVEELVSEGLVRTEQVEASTYVYVTDSGYEGFTAPAVEDEPQASVEEQPSEESPAQEDTSSGEAPESVAQEPEYQTQE